MVVLSLVCVLWVCGGVAGVVVVVLCVCDGGGAWVVVVVVDCVVSWASAGIESANATSDPSRTANR